MVEGDVGDCLLSYSDTPRPPIRRLPLTYAGMVGQYPMFICPRRHVRVWISWEAWEKAMEKGGGEVGSPNGKQGHKAANIGARTGSSHNRLQTDRDYHQSERTLTFPANFVLISAMNSAYGHCHCDRACA